MSTAQSSYGMCLLDKILRPRVTLYLPSNTRQLPACETALAHSRCSQNWTPALYSLPGFLPPGCMWEAYVNSTGSCCSQAGLTVLPRAWKWWVWLWMALHQLSVTVFIVLRKHLEVECAGRSAGRQKHNLIKSSVLQAPVCPCYSMTCRYLALWVFDFGYSWVWKGISLWFAQPGGSHSWDWGLALDSRCWGLLSVSVEVGL